MATISSKFGTFEAFHFNPNVFREKEELNNKFIGMKLQTKEKETESKQMQSKLSEATESCTNLKNLLEATQQVSEWICRLISLHKIRPLATSYSFSVVHCPTTSHSTTPHPMNRARRWYTVVTLLYDLYIGLAIFCFKWEGGEQITFSKATYYSLSSSMSR